MNHTVLFSKYWHDWVINHVNEHVIHFKGIYIYTEIKTETEKNSKTFQDSRYKQWLHLHVCVWIIKVSLH